MKTNSILLSFMIMCSFGLFAQSNQPLKANSVEKAAYVRNIPALSKMKNIISAKGLGHHAQAKKRGKNKMVPGKGLPNGNDPLAYLQKKNNIKHYRAPLKSFDAHKGNVLNDPTGAIGPNHYVYAFNSGFGILDRDGKVLLPEASLATLFPGEDLGDPIVVYDNFAKRFIIMEFSDSPNGFLVAVCKGEDPINDGWSTYRYNTSDFPDYEKLSIWNDGYYITANTHQGSQETSDVIFVLERDKMIAGDADARIIKFPLAGAKTNGFYSPGGINATGATLPPAGTPCSIIYFQDDSWSGVSKDHLKMWDISINWSNPNSSTISQPKSIDTAPFDSVFHGGNFNNLAELDGNQRIDAIQSTMMYMTNYRRFGSHNSIVLNFTIDVNGDDTTAAIRWYELRQSGDNQPWSVYQEGTYTQPDGHSAFCGSIAQDSQGNIGLGYTIVSASIHTSLRYTGRMANDPLGTMTVVESVSANGDKPTPFGDDGRYGDYAQMTIDPLDGDTFWHIAEYMKGNSQRRKSHVVAFKLAGDTTPDPDTQAPSAPSNLAASNTTTTQTSLSWEVSTDNVGVIGYNVLQGGSVIATVTGTSYNVIGLTSGTSYSFTVVANDAAGNTTASNSINLTTESIDVNDTEAPSAPGNLASGMITTTSISLTWDAATDNVGVASYDVLQENNVIATITGTSYNVTGLTSDTSYSFSVIANDAAGNSTSSSAINASTANATVADTEAPDSPSNLTSGSITSTTVSLTWDAATDNVGVTGYIVIQNGETIATITDTAYTVTGLTSDTSYNFEVIAVDAVGLESLESDSLSVTTQTTGGDSGCDANANLPYSESFESGLGDWTQDTSDNINWNINSAGTPSDNTGPSSASNGSSYIYVESTMNANQTAILNSPCFDLSSPKSANFSFAYHMYGEEAFGSLDLQISIDNGDNWKRIWRKTGNQGNDWRDVSLDLSPYVGSIIRLRFVRVIDKSGKADVAIDMVSFTASSDLPLTESSCVNGDLDLQITFDSNPEETSWILRDQNGDKVMSKGYTSSEADNSTVNEVVTGLENGEYTFTIFDEYNDGLCCDFGNGSYTLSIKGVEIASGSSFQDSESTSFCIDKSRIDTFELADANAEDSRFILSPNPVNNVLNIAIDKTPIDKIAIFSMYGHLVETFKNHGTKGSIDVSRFSTGSYFARIYANGTIVTRRFVKE